MIIDTWQTATAFPNIHLNVFLSEFEAKPKELNPLVSLMDYLFRVSVIAVGFNRLKIQDSVYNFIEAAQSQLRVLNLGPDMIYSDAFLTELTCQVLIDGNLTFVFAPIDF